MKTIRELSPWPKDMNPPTWWDLTNPTEEDLKFVADTFLISRSTLLDCLQPVHLPQFVKADSWNELLLRSYEERSQRESTVQDITRKFVIFWGANFIVTIKRKEVSFFEQTVELIRYEGERLRQTTSNKKLNGADSETCHEQVETIVAILARGVLSTYEKGLDEIEQGLDVCESSIASSQEQSEEGMKKLHRIKKKISIMRRILWRTAEVLETSSAEMRGRKGSRWRQRNWKTQFPAL
jgi:magnesium transporter